MSFLESVPGFRLGLKGHLKEDKPFGFPHVEAPHGKQQRVKPGISRTGKTAKTQTSTTTNTSGKQTHTGMYAALEKAFCVSAF